MPQDVYADLLFLINFSMDYLCLYVCAKVMGRRIRLPRFLLSAAVGGIYSVVSLFLSVTSLLSIVIDVGVCLIMCAIVFAEKGRRLSSTLLCTFLFVGISMMTGGCMTAIFNFLNRLDLPLSDIGEDGISTYLFALLAAIAGFISLRSGELISKRAPIKECKVKITFQGQEIELLGFADSGNLVKDPISGKAVIIVDKETVAKSLPIVEFDMFKQGKATKNLPFGCLRLIPINTASGKGILVAALPEKTVIEYEHRKKRLSFEVDTLFAPSEIGKSAEGYTAIVPQEIFKP